jgi:hypothetical protein
VTVTINITDQGVFVPERVRTSILCSMQATKRLPEDLPAVPVRYDKRILVDPPSHRRPHTRKADATPQHGNKGDEHDGHHAAPNHERTRHPPGIRGHLVGRNRTVSVTVTTTPPLRKLDDQSGDQPTLPWETMHGQASLDLPLLHRPNVHPEIGGDLLPGGKLTIRLSTHERTSRPDGETASTTLPLRPARYQ